MHAGEAADGPAYVERLRVIAMLRHFARMFSATILILVVVDALGLALAAQAGFIGIPLALTLFSWFFKYAYALLDSVAHGVDEPPVMSVEMVNPLSQRPLAQLAVCGGAVAAVLWTDGALRWALIAFFVATLPASVAILGVTGNIVQALNPWALVTVVRKLGRCYLEIVAACVVMGILLILVLPTSLWLIAKLCVAQLAILSVFNLIGAALYERRDALDIDVTHSPEKNQELREQERQRQRSRMIDAMYTQARVRKYEAMDAIQKEWLDAASQQELEIDVPFIVTSAVSWDDQRALARIAAPGILQLHAGKSTTDALDSLESALNCDSTFQLGNVKATVELAELAKAAGRRALARKIVSTCGDAAGSTLDIVNRLQRLKADLQR